MIRLMRYNKETDSMEPVEVKIDQPEAAPAQPADESPSLASYRQIVEPAWQSRFDELAGLLEPFCREHLDDDYLHMCLKLAAAICHDGTPVGRGKAAGWAAGIVHAIGDANFLNDPSFLPHMNLTDIGPHFGVSKATSGKRGREIIDGAGVGPFNAEWLIDSPDMASMMQTLAEIMGLQSPDMATMNGEQAPHPVQRRRRPRCTAMLRLRIDMRDSRPPIWRRIEVPDSLSLGDLHIVLQIAFDWEECHLHSFEAPDGRRFEPPAAFDDAFFMGPPSIDEGDVYLCDLRDQFKKKVVYTYDFGDSWEHIIKLEKVTPVNDGKALRPRCLDGRRAAPPEDCGGMWGYENLLAALADPAHEEHEFLSEWIGDDWDAQAFDAEAIDRRLAAAWRI